MIHKGKIMTNKENKKLRDKQKLSPLLSPQGQLPLKPVHMPEELQSNLQIFDLKQLADMEATYKTHCQKAVADYKSWDKRYSGETDTIALLYGNLEGAMLRRNAENSVGAYWTIRRDFRRWFQRYLEQASCYPSARS
jgi:hypothetical protein